VGKIEPEGPPRPAKGAKRTGIAGPYRAQSDGQGHAEGSFLQIKFPEVKADVEGFIAERFISSMNSGPGRRKSMPFFHTLRRNEENDFDFSVMQGGRPAYLELTEIVSPEKMRSERGYPNDGKYNPVEFAKDIHDNIMKKSNHYGRMQVRVFLFAYSTHWSFSLSDSTLVCLRAMLHKSRPGFEAIFGFSLHDEREGDVRWLFPVQAHLRPREALWRLRDSLAIAVDPREFRVVSSARSQDESTTGG
jgi:hypothetical protein